MDAKNHMRQRCSTEAGAERHRRLRTRIRKNDLSLLWPHLAAATEMSARLALLFQKSPFPPLTREFPAQPTPVVRRIPTAAVFVDWRVSISRSPMLQARLPPD